MAEDGRQQRLGRGLSALLGDDSSDYASLDRVRTSKEIPIEFLKPNPDQPRRTFDEDALKELAISISEKGILQPILVRQAGDETNDYQIVAGERRWRAAQRAGLHNVPVIVKDLTDAETLEIALIENVQRSDLNPVDEAQGYQALLKEFSYTQDELSKIIGKSRSHIANAIRLLSLPAAVADMLVDGRLTAGHARTLIGADDAEDLAREIISRGLNVRETENLVRGGAAPKRTKRSLPHEKDPDTLALEDNLSSSLGLKVSVDHKGEKGGLIRIQYLTLEQLDDLCQRLTGFNG
jgi:ParB family transcriptional regulator, chromosome partitioning protein